MKRIIVFLLIVACAISFLGCNNNENKYTIEIIIPAGSKEAFVYSTDEICPIGKKIVVSAGAGLIDTEVILKPVNDNITTGYVATYLTQGMPVEFDTENVNDEWFKIGVSVQNDSERGPIAVEVEVEGVEARKADVKETVSDDASRTSFLDEGEIIASHEGNLKNYFEMSDGTWQVDGYTYKYRLEISGTQPLAVKETTYIILSNREDISFHDAMMASGISSNTNDYFSVEDAVFVEIY